jgi:hypothetical protein
MAKFKIGDKVQVNKNHSDLIYTQKLHIGEIGVILNYTGDDREYIVKFSDDYNIIFNESKLLPAHVHLPIPKPTQKLQLKKRSIFTLNRNGELFISHPSNNQCKSVGHKRYEYNVKIKCADKLDKDGFLIDQLIIHQVLKETLRKMVVLEFYWNKLKIKKLKG